MATIVIDGREVIDVDADPDTRSDVADAHLLVKDLAGGKLKRLRGDGVIGDDEFVQGKKKALGIK